MAGAPGAPYDRALMLAAAATLLAFATRPSEALTIRRSAFALARPGGCSQSGQMQSSPAVDEAVTRIVAIGGLAAVALIHVLQLPEAFESEGYLGALFIVAIVAAVVLGAVLTRMSDDRTWMAVGALPALILIGYLLSRTSGLPGFTTDVGEWTEPLGLASMVVEGMLVCVSGAVLATRRAVPGLVEVVEVVEVRTGPPTSPGRAAPAA